MTQTEIETYAQVTLRYLPDAMGAHATPEAAYLDLIEQGKTELEALEAGMVGQAPEQRALQNTCWSAQNRALEDIVLAALQAGTPSAAITAITHRASW